jgi:hypothetical protein
VPVVRLDAGMPSETIYVHASIQVVHTALWMPHLTKLLHNRLIQIPYSWANNLWAEWAY